jgi:16S rRNA (adenine1518-N6/adenine1519-N6)-dimethyltransferase
VEKDSRLVEQSKDWRRDYPNLAVIRADILKLNVKPYAAKPWVIVGNLPYYLTGKLLRTMVEQWPKPKRLVFMLQKEVAQRLTNPKRFSKISVFAQLYGKLEIIKHVAPGAFSPPPKVWSSIIKIEPHKTAFPELNQPPFKTLITKAFSSPRKYLINNLKDLYPEPDINHGLKELEISARARAETILPQQWIRFYKLLSKQPH